ncbi:MAG: aspartate aminotransferase family protein [Desulforhopalus sp.]|nr:aspartate aminotransferase family protein [Desulforhopalus sp.]
MENGQSNAEWKKRADQVIVGSYNRYPATIIEGKGCRVKDANGKSYLDFLAGIAVTALGHSHPKVTAAITEQAAKLVHISNLWYTTPMVELAELLVANCFADRVFFCNSGAEANEAAIKMARIASSEGRYKIISLEGSFHGRTLATVAATGQPRFHKGFEPMPAGFVYAPFGDLDALEKMVDDETCAIMCEAIQGESGVRPMPQEYIEGIRKLCDKYEIFLIFDEVQTGMGRIGHLFGHQYFGVTPDIITLAKALANGLPAGAMLTTDKIAAKMVPGSHASTFGGNPVVCAAGLVVVKELLSEGFLEGVRDKGAWMMKRLDDFVQRFPDLITGSRGAGLLVGATLTKKGIEHGSEIVNRMFENGVLINFAGGRVLRFAPPLIVTRDEIDEMLNVLGGVLAQI